MAASLKMTTFWDIALCSLVEVEQRFRGSYCRHHALIALMMEAVRTSETSVNFYETTRRRNPEDHSRHLHRRENLKSLTISTNLIVNFCIWCFRFELAITFIPGIITIQCLKRLRILLQNIVNSFRVCLFLVFNALSYKFDDFSNTCVTRVV
jgi:hypothetical protein